MDINEYKKYAIPKIEVGKMADIVRKTIKEVEYAKQDKYEDIKETYKPVTQKIKKGIDEISHLREEYKLREEFKEFLKLVDIPISFEEFKQLKKNPIQEIALPPVQQIAPPPPLLRFLRNPPPPPPPPPILDLFKNFTKDDIDFLDTHGWPAPDFLLHQSEPVLEEINKMALKDQKSFQGRVTFEKKYKKQN